MSALSRDMFAKNNASNHHEVALFSHSKVTGKIEWTDAAQREMNASLDVQMVSAEQTLNQALKMSTTLLCTELAD